MCTIHANSAREAVTKMCTLPLLAGENVGHAFVVPTVAACVDLVVHARASSADGIAPGAGDRRRARAGRGRRRRDRRPLHDRATAAGPRRGLAAAPRSGSSAPGYDLAALLAEAAG